MSFTGFGPTWANRVMDSFLGSEPVFVRPGTVYVALFVAPGVEVSGTNYSRVGVPNNNAYWAVANSGKKYNLQEISFPPAGFGGWSFVDGVGIFDALSGGNLMVVGSFSAQSVSEGDTVKIAPGGAQFGLRIPF